MKKELFSSFFEREKVLTDESYIFYHGDEADRNIIGLRIISPLFLFLFVLPLIFVYLFFTLGATNLIFKIGLLLFLEFSMWIFDLWIKESFYKPHAIWLWLIQIPIVVLIFFCL